MKHNHLFNRFTALTIALTLSASLAACSGRQNAPEDASSSGRPNTGSAEFINPLSPVDPKNAIAKAQAPATDVLEKINKAYNINSDVVGWLNVPGTTIDEEVVQYTDNDFYLRRDINKTPNVKEGLYYADYECKFGDRNSMSKNSIIYGHNLGQMEMGQKDDPNGIKFAQLHKFDDISFAKEHPYFNFTTEQDNMTFKIFAVMYTDTDFGYIYPNMKTSDYKNVIKGMRDRSVYDYDVDVNTDDKIMSLSTCTYKYGAYGTPQYDKARFVVVGRLLRPGETLEQTASLTANTDAKAPQFG